MLVIVEWCDGNDSPVDPLLDAPSFSLPTPLTPYHLFITDEIEHKGSTTPFLLQRIVVVCASWRCCWENRRQFTERKEGARFEMGKDGGGGSHRPLSLVRGEAVT